MSQAKLPNQSRNQSDHQDVHMISVYKGLSGKIPHWVNVERYSAFNPDGGALDQDSRLLTVLPCASPKINAGDFWQVACLCIVAIVYDTSGRRQSETCWEPDQSAVWSSWILITQKNKTTRPSAWSRANQTTLLSRPMLSPPCLVNFGSFPLRSPPFLVRPSQHYTV